MEDTQSLWTAKSPGPQSVFLRCLHRALPQWRIPRRHEGWQHGTCRCTTSQLCNPGCSSVPGKSQCTLGHEVLPKTPRAGHPRWHSQCPDTDVAPGAQEAASSASYNCLQGLDPSANTLISQVRATTHKGTLSAFSPRQAAALQVENRNLQVENFFSFCYFYPKDAKYEKCKVSVNLKLNDW